MTDSRAGSGEVQDEHEHLVPESKEVLKMMDMPRRGVAKCEII